MFINGRIYKNNVLQPHDGIAIQLFNPTRQEELIHSTAWMNLDNLMLNGKSQKQKATYCMIPFLVIVQNKQIHKGRK